MDMVTYLMLLNKIRQSGGAASENFAPEYDPTRTYEAGDYAIFNGILKQFDGSEWNEVSVSDALKELQNGKLDVNQGEENAGKFMVVGEDGDVIPADAPAVIIDDTLSISGAAAEAKTVGDRLREKADKTGGFTAGNVVTTDIDGKLIDGGAPASEILNKVDYSKAQTLTEAQKAIARFNIGAAAAKATPSSWAEIGALVEAGFAESVLEVGDQITAERATAIAATITGSGASSPTVELQDFIEAIGEAAPAVYIFVYTANGWAYDGKLITLSDYGIAVSGTPVVGQEIHVVESTTQETYDVMAVDGYDTPVEAGKTHAVSLLTHDVISYNEIPFDPVEALYAVDADTWPDGMPAGTYHIILDHGCYNGSIVQDGAYEFTTTQLIPVGGKIRHSTIGLYQSTEYTQEQILNGKFTTYNADFSILESNIATTLGSDGTSIGTTTASNPTYLVGNHLNFSQRNSYGSNRWDLCSDRKYLQSKAKGAASGAIASWWYATGEFDMPVRSTKPGYLYGLDPAFVKVLGAVKKRTALSIADGYGYMDTEDLVWLASMTEVFPTSTTNPVGQKNNNIAETSFGADGATLQQNCYPYWEGSTNDDRIKYHGTTARLWWLRGPSPSYAYGVRYVSTSGALNNRSAYNAYGVVPGLCITGNPLPPTE